VYEHVDTENSVMIVSLCIAAFMMLQQGA